MASFPTYAKILLQGRTEAANFGVLRTDMDGLPKQRPRWTKPIVTRQAQVMVRSLANKIAFDGWLETDLNGGAGWFDYADPWRPGGVLRARIVSGAVEWMSMGRGLFVATCQIETIG